MSYVQMPSLSWFSQVVEPDASGVVSGAMSDALMRDEPNSIPRTAAPDRISSATPPFRSVTGPSSAHRPVPSERLEPPASAPATDLAVVGRRPVLAAEVTLQQRLVDRS